MNPCKCEMCSPTPAPTWTRTWMLECLAREMLRRMDVTQRREHIAKLQRERGESAANLLRQALSAEWEKR